MNEFGNEAAPVTGHDYVSAVEFLAAKTEVAGKERRWEIGRNGIIPGRLRIHTCIQHAVPTDAGLAAFARCEVGRCVT